jgi:hypothetical protein
MPLNLTFCLLYAGHLPAKHVGRAEAGPYVECMMIGLPTDTSKRMRTRPFRAKGLCPRWNTDNCFQMNSVSIRLNHARLCSDYSSLLSRLFLPRFMPRDSRIGYPSRHGASARCRVRQAAALSRLGVCPPQQHAPRISPHSSPGWHCHRCLHACKYQWPSYSIRMLSARIFPATYFFFLFRTRVRTLHRSFSRSRSASTYRRTTLTLSRTS